MNNPVKIFITVLIVTPLIYLAPGNAKALDELPLQTPEIGLVKWSRDFEGTLAKSKTSGKPVFALFQEVPGCHGCKEFGRTVLSEPLIVEAIEDEFEPILIFNNRGGKDAAILKRYREPSWNFQVIRFLDSSGKDIIARKDRIWTIPNVTSRMVKALTEAGRAVPDYLRLLNAAHNANLQEAVFAMHCFWTGEQVLGGLPGVYRTEAGFFDGREVVRIWYDPAQIRVSKLLEYAARHSVADKIYLPLETSSRFQDAAKKLRIPLAAFEAKGYRKAPSSDQARQLQGTHYMKLTLGAFQRTKLNAFVRTDPRRAKDYLSPRQRVALLELK